MELTLACEQALGLRFLSGGGGGGVPFPPPQPFPQQRPKPRALELARRLNLRNRCEHECLLFSEGHKSISVVGKNKFLV